MFMDPTREDHEPFAPLCNNYCVCLIIYGTTRFRLLVQLAPLAVALHCLECCPPLSFLLVSQCTHESFAFRSITAVLPRTVHQFGLPVFKLHIHDFQRLVPNVALRAQFHLPLAFVMLRDFRLLLLRRWRARRPLGGVAGFLCYRCLQVLAPDNDLPYFIRCCETQWHW